MRDNCFRPDGTPRSITSARFQVLGPDRIQWELFGDVDVLNHSEVIASAELPAILEITGALLQDSAHAQKENAPAPARSHEETDRVP